MGKKFTIILLIIEIAFLISGFVIIFNATNLGYNIGLNIFTNSIDKNFISQEISHWMMQSYAISFQISGTILSALGGFSLLITLFKFKKINHSL